MSPTTVIVVSGLPCSGKSTLAMHLHQALHWPLFAKDAFKESLFDSLGIGDREWSRKLSEAAYELLFAQALESVRRHESCIVEGNFRAGRFEERFRELATSATLSQAHCHAPPETLIHRFRERMPSRHVGHVDAESLVEIETELRTDPQRPLAIDAEIVECDSDGAEDWYVRASDEILKSLRR